MRHIPGPLIPIEIIAWTSELPRRVIQWWCNPQCHLCLERHHNLEAHMIAQHAEWTDISPERDARWHDA